VCIQEKLKFEQENLKHSLKQASKEKTKETLVEGKKLWKKIIYGIISYSKKVKEIQSFKIKNAKKFSLLCQKEVQSKMKKTSESQSRAKKLNKDVSLDVQI
jgi:hypothetical protein